MQAEAAIAGRDRPARAQAEPIRPTGNLVDLRV